MDKNVVYRVNDARTGRLAEVEYYGGAWWVRFNNAVFQFFTYASAKRGARIMAGMDQE